MKLSGLQKLCRSYGRMQINGIMYAWDYVNECALPEKDLKNDKERWAASEKIKWLDIKNKLDQIPPSVEAQKVIDEKFWDLI